MIDIGHFSLAQAWLFSLLGLVVGLVAAIKKDLKLYLFSANSVRLVFIFSLISLISLALAFLTHDYRFSYVWRTSNNDMPAMYLISAIWGGMEGSLLFWSVIISIFAAVVVRTNLIASEGIKFFIVPAVALSNFFFFTIVLFLSNPFQFIPGDIVPTDGNGMNPLLQNLSMLIHPPLLYLGFTGFMVPFSYCFAALLSGELDKGWTRLTRASTLVAWIFLTAGVILGGNWAYIELGWGGFWAWDPVENASFMPWLLGTAFLHSVMVQERRGMLKLWNICLAIGTYLFAIFGTFLTRSGIVQSVHAFAETDIGWVFLAYIGFLFICSLILIYWRYDKLKPEAQIESFFSREAVFLLNNILLFSICFATFWGVMFPIISEAVTGEKSVVGPPFFNKVTSPLFTLLLFFMGVGPLIAWKKARFSALKKAFLRSLIFGSIVFVIGVFVDPSRPFAALFFGVSAFVFSTILIELYRAAKISGGIVKLAKQRTRRVGGFIVHLGVVVMAVSMAASTIYKTEKDITLALGETKQIGGYQISLLELKEIQEQNYQAVRAEVDVSYLKNGVSKNIKSLFPERRFYQRKKETTTEVALYMSLKEDLYLAFAGLEEIDGVEKLALKVYLNPLQIWVWFGGLVMLFGALLLLFTVKNLEHKSSKIKLNT